MIEEIGAKLTSYLSKHNSVLVCRRPEGSKYKKAKEWNIAVVNTAWLSDLVIGNLSIMSQFESNKYQQYNLTGPFRIDYALVGHLLAAWKAPINLTQEAHERVKRSLTEPSPEPEPKRVKITPPLEDIPEAIVTIELPDPDKLPRVCFTQIDNHEGLTRAVTTLGGIVVEEPEHATHLVMTRIARSCKFVKFVALCVINFIVKSDWIVESAKAGKFLPLDGFKVKDEKFEDDFSFNIEKVLESPYRRTIFSGKIFYVTPSVFPVKSEICKMIELGGGRIEPKRRSAVLIAEVNVKSSDTYMIISCPNDIHLMYDLTKPGKPKCLICSTEAIMSSILKQQLEIEPHIIPLLNPKK